MTESLFPERPLQVSPSLAASIGLEQAILLQHLDFSVQILSASNATTLNNQYQWGATSLTALTEQLPFWNPATIRRILQNLLDLGMIFIEPFPSSEKQIFHFAINQKVSTEAKSQATATTSLGAHRIPANWQPEPATVEQLIQQGVARTFIAAQINEFVLYWRERNETSHAWSSKFLQHISRRWQREQQQYEQQARRQAQKQQSSANIERRWQPSEDALEILLRMGIHQNFIDDAIAEFILYWQERGEAQTTWNSKFVGHVKRQWARYTHTLKNDTEPVPMTDNWQPDQDVFEVLSIANIDLEFAQGLIPEFMMYWRDKNELHHSWNTKFLQYCKYQWSRKHNENTNNGTHRQNAAKRRTKDRSLLEDLTDRSWAS